MNQDDPGDLFTGDFLGAGEKLGRRRFSSLDTVSLELGHTSGRQGAERKRERRKCILYSS